MNRGPGTAGGEFGSITQIRRAVAEFDAVTERELRSRERMLTELGRLARPFDREADPVHMTGSGIVMGRRGTVLHRHKRLGIWVQPGGHIDPGETPWQAAWRETGEETGLRVRHPTTGPYLLHLDVHSAGDHVHLDLRYLLFGEDAEPRPPDDESQDVRWFSLPEAMTLADEALVDGLARAVRLRRERGPVQP